MRRRSLPAAGVLAAVLAGALALATPRVTLAADVSWGTPEATSTYGEVISFRQPATVPVGYSRVEVLLDFPGADGPFVAEVGRQVSGTSTILGFDYAAAASHLYPNTRVGARWRVTLADGTVDVGPRVTTTYADSGFPWRTKTGKIVRLHWYEGDDAFADRALALGEAAIEKASKILGVTETEPVDFFVYASEDAFYAAAGPGTRENVGGFALSDIRTLFGLITPDEISDPWVGVVVPHELTHLVFDTAVENPYHYPPRWLNEGVAVYLSEGYTPSYRKDLRDGVNDGRTLPLEALASEFPTGAEQWFLAYAEGVSAVSYIVDTYGQDALVSLIRAYAEGVSDDDAFRTGLGVTLADVEAGWLKSIDAKAPERAGPQPAPPGPVPSDWSGQAGPGAAPTAPASGAPAASGTPAASADVSASPSGGATGEQPGRTDAGGLLVALAVFVAAVALGVAFAARSRGRRPPSAGPSPPPVEPGSPEGPSR